MIGLNRQDSRRRSEITCRHPCRGDQRSRPGIRRHAYILKDERADEERVEARKGAEGASAGRNSRDSGGHGKRTEERQVDVRHRNCRVAESRAEELHMSLLFIRDLVENVLLLGRESGDCGHGRVGRHRAGRRVAGV